MSLSNPFSRRLYLRIWLAVVGGMAVLTLTVGWAWRIAEEQKAQTAQPFVPPSREMVLRDPEGQLVLRGPATRHAQPTASVSTAMPTTTVSQMRRDRRRAKGLESFTAQSCCLANT